MFIVRFSRMNRIFAGLWFGKGKPHFPTFLQPFAYSLRTLYNPGNYRFLASHKMDLQLNSSMGCDWMLAPKRREGRGVARIFPRGVTLCQSEGTHQIFTMAKISSPVAGCLI